MQLSSQPVTTTTPWSQWLAAALAERDWTPADLIRAVRDKAFKRLDDGLLSRWLSGDAIPQMDNIRIVCRALGVPAVEGMIAAGRLEPDDVGVTFIRQRTRAVDMSARELSEEVTRLIYEAKGAEAVNPTDGHASPVANPFVTNVGQEGESWAARRRKTDETLSDRND